MRNRNEDWCDGECISIWQEKNEARMKWLNRNTRQNRELYNKKGKKHIDCIERKRER
jgi:hypothetical protein